MPLLEDDLIDGVGARRCRIHVCLPDRSILIAFLQLAIDSFVTVDRSILHLLDVDSFLWILTNS